MVMSIWSVETELPPVKVKQGDIRDLFLTQPGRVRPGSEADGRA